MSDPLKPLTPTELSDIKAEADDLAAANPSGLIGDMNVAILRLAATVRELEQRQAWQPIETAPKGVRVLIWVRDDEPDHVFAWTNDSGDMDEWPEGATHWQPLPAPPSEALSTTEPQPADATADRKGGE